MKYDYLVVGAGFAGAVMAERIASQLNKKVLIVEKRNHIGGNAYDEYDEHGILIHKYGPHVFHTSNKKVFDYLSQFTEWQFYEHKVLASLNDELYPFPINRITINKLYKKKFTCEREVADFLQSKRENRFPVLNSEDIIVNQVGCDLFEKFFRNYTKKQWNLEPSELSPEVCGRIPIRMNEDCRYFEDKYQYMPKKGYAELFKNMLRHKNIEILLNVDYKNILADISFKKLIYTGPIDYYFDYEFGKLPYRSLRFEHTNINCKSYQEAAQINYVDSTKKYTRVIEHKKITLQNSSTTTITKEYPEAGDEPFYPIPNDDTKQLYQRYRKKAEDITNILFCGRLAEYQYYNMDQVVANSLKTFEGLTA